MIEPRNWLHHPDEVAEARRLGRRIRYRIGDPLARQPIPADDAERYADLVGRDTARRELMMLRRRIEQWPNDPQFQYLTAAVLLEDLAAILDERISHHGGREPKS